VLNITCGSVGYIIRLFAAQCYILFVRLATLSALLIVADFRRAVPDAPAARRRSETVRRLGDPAHPV
jgi:hypothetical protein